jgi:hypothetical protein
MVAYPKRHFAYSLYIRPNRGSTWPFKSGQSTNDPLVPRHHADGQLEDLGSSHLDDASGIARELIRQFLQDPKRLIGKVEGAFDGLFRESSTHILLLIRVAGFLYERSARKHERPLKANARVEAGAGVMFCAAQWV